MQKLKQAEGGIFMDFRENRSDFDMDLTGDGKIDMEDEMLDWYLYQQGTKSDQNPQAARFRRSSPAAGKKSGCADHVAKEETFRVQEDAGLQDLASDAEMLQNQRRKLASQILSGAVSAPRREYDRAMFIRRHFYDTVAARYLDPMKGFLYRDAAVLQFSLPEQCFIQCKNDSFSSFLAGVYQYSPSVCMEVWSWCTEQFLPWHSYGDNTAEELLVIRPAADISDIFWKDAVHYFSDHPDFLNDFIRYYPRVTPELGSLIASSLQEGLDKPAEKLFFSFTDILKSSQASLLTFIRYVILACKKKPSPDVMPALKKQLFPHAEQLVIPEFQPTLDAWKAEINEIIHSSL